MDNPSREEALKRLATLSRQERNTLRLVCHGRGYLAITEELFISMSSVKQYMGRVYMKLGLDILEERAERMKAIYQVYCPLLQETDEGLDTGSETSEEVVSAEVIAEIPPTISPEVQEMVDEDGYALIHVASAPLNRPPPRPRRRYGLIGLVLGVVLGICLGTGAVILILQPDILTRITGIGSTPTVQITLGELQESPSPVPEIATQTPVIIEQVVVVTATSLPATPTPTQAPLPSVPLPFSDNFELRARPEWETITGTWRVLDGHFTGENNDQWQIVFVGDPNWRNYRIEVTSFSKDYIYPIRIIARASYEGYIAFEYYNWGSRWLLVKSGQEIELTSDTDRLYWDRTYNLKLEAKDDIFTVYMDGIQYSQIQDTTISNGRVGIGYDSRYLTWFDDYVVTELP